MVNSKKYTPDQINKKKRDIASKAKIWSEMTNISDEEYLKAINNSIRKSIHSKILTHVLMRDPTMKTEYAITKADNLLKEACEIHKSKTGNRKIYGSYIEKTALGLVKKYNLGMMPNVIQLRID